LLQNIINILINFCVAYDLNGQTGYKISPVADQLFYVQIVGKIIVLYEVEDLLP